MRSVLLYVGFVVFLTIGEQGFAGGRFEIYNLQPPSYPQRCLAKHIEGTVVLEFRISRHGKIEAVHAVDIPPRCPEFAHAALSAVRKAKTRGLDSGETIEEQTITVPVTFTTDPS